MEHHHHGDREDADFSTLPRRPAAGLKPLCFSLLNRLFEIAAVERFLQHPRSFKAFRQPGSAVSAGKEKRYPSLAQNFGDREGLLSGQINVENRKVDICSLSQLKRRLQPHGWTDNVESEIRQVVFDLHCNKGFVLNQKNTFFGLFSHRKHFLR